MKRLIGALFAVTLLTTVTVAQVNPFGQFGGMLNSQDLDLLQAAARTLYVDRTPVNDARASWQNPATGNSGLVKIAGIRHDPRYCIFIAHKITVATVADPKIFVFQRCRTAGGWEVVW